MVVVVVVDWRWCIYDGGKWKLLCTYIHTHIYIYTHMQGRALAAPEVDVPEGNGSGKLGSTHCGAACILYHSASGASA